MGCGFSTCTRARARWGWKRCPVVRGHVLFVEADARAARVIRGNIDTLGLPGG